MMDAAIREKLRLLVVTDGQGRADLEAVVEAALRGGARAVQLREKTLSPDALAALGRRLRAATARHGALLIVNHDVALSQAIQADGVHLGWRSVSPAKARQFLGAGALIGVSTHNVEQVRQAADAGADYVVFGPVHDTPSKRGLVATQGLDGLRQAVAEVAPFPVLAIGGIGVAQAPDAVGAGAAGVAVIRSVLDAADPEAAARRMLEALGAARVGEERGSL